MSFNVNIKNKKKREEIQRKKNPILIIDSLTYLKCYLMIPIHFRTQD